MSRRLFPSTSVVGPVSKPSPEELFRFLDKWHRGQWPEFWRQLQNGLLPLNVIQMIIEHKNPFETLTSYEYLLRWHSGWPRFWRAFGFKYDHEALVLPDYREGFGWSLVTPNLADWPMSRLLHEVCGRMFQTWQYYQDEDLDKITSPKEPTDVHVILAHDCVEADEVHKNKSAQMIESKNISTMTIRQRTVLEARYFFETNGHLDIVNLTRCDGSRYADGHVPYANWHDDKFRVSDVDPDSASDHWRVREIVS